VTDFFFFLNKLPFKCIAKPERNKENPQGQQMKGELRMSSVYGLNAVTVLGAFLVSVTKRLAF